MQLGCHCDLWGAGRHKEAMGGKCLSFLIQSLVPISPSVWWDFLASALGSPRDWKPQRLGLGSTWSWFCWESAETARCQEWSRTPLDARRAQTGDWGQQPVLEPGRSSLCCSAPRSSGKRNPTQGEFMENAPSPLGGQTIPPREMLAYLLPEDREKQTFLVIVRQAGAPLLQNTPHPHHTIKAGKGLGKLFWGRCVEQFALQLGILCFFPKVAWPLGLPESASSPNLFPSGKRNFFLFFCTAETSQSLTTTLQ